MIEPDLRQVACHGDAMLCHADLVQQSE